MDRFGSTTYTNPSLPRHPQADGNPSEPVQQASKVSLSVMEMTSSSCSYALFYAGSAVIFKFDTEVPVSLDAI